MNVEWANCAEVERTPRKVGGAWVFRGTRVPMRALFDKDGHSDDDDSIRPPTLDRAGAAAEDSA